MLDMFTGRIIIGASSGELSDNAVTTEKLAANAVTTAKIADSSVTTDKLDPDALDSVISAQNAGVLGYPDKAIMDADLTPDDSVIAWVTNDATASNNGTYRKSGATGTGSWIQSSYDRVTVLEAEVDAIPSFDSLAYEVKTLEDTSTFTADTTLDSSGSAYTKTGSSLSPFFAVVPELSRLRVVLKSDYIGVCGYDETFVKVATLSTKTETGLDVVVPAGVYYIRYSIKDVNIPACVVNIRALDGDVNRTVDEDLSLNGSNYFYSPDEVKYGVNNNSGTPILDYYSGTGFVPVTEGDVVYYLFPECNYPTYGNTASLPLTAWDSSFNFVSTFELTADDYTAELLGSVEITDSSIAYIVASTKSDVAFVDSANEYYLFVDSTMNEAATNFVNLIKERSLQTVFEEKSKDSWDSLLDATAVDDVVTFSDSTSGFIYMVDDDPPELPVLATVSLKIAYRCDLELVSGTGPVEIQDYTIDGGCGRKWILDDVGSTLSIFGQSSSGLANLVCRQACEVRVTNIQKVCLNANVVDTYMDGRNLEDAFALTEGSVVSAMSMSTLGTALRATKRRITFFGDSITEGTSGGFVELVAQRFSAPVTNLALSGSYPTKKSTDAVDATSWNLRDNNLALIPEDTGVVVILGGVNYTNPTLGDIDSVNREEAYGALNYAISYIETNHPYARIVLCTPPPARDTDDVTAIPITTHITAFTDVAANRNLELADIAGRSGLNSNTLSFCYFDENHPLMEGNYRIAAVIVDAIRKIMY